MTSILFTTPTFAHHSAEFQEPLCPNSEKIWGDYIIWASLNKKLNAGEKRTSETWVRSYFGPISCGAVDAVTGTSLFTRNEVKALLQIILSEAYFDPFEREINLVAEHPEDSAGLTQLNMLAHYEYFLKEFGPSNNSDGLSDLSPEERTAEIKKRNRDFWYTLLVDPDTSLEHTANLKDRFGWKIWAGYTHSRYPTFQDFLKATTRN